MDVEWFLDGLTADEARGGGWCSSSKVCREEEEEEL